MVLRIPGNLSSQLLSGGKFLLKAPLCAGVVTAASYALAHKIRASDWYQDTVKDCATKSDLRDRVLVSPLYLLPALGGTVLTHLIASRFYSLKLNNHLTPITQVVIAGASIYLSYSKRTDDLDLNYSNFIAAGATHMALVAMLVAASKVTPAVGERFPSFITPVVGSLTAGIVTNMLQNGVFKDKEALRYLILIPLISNLVLSQICSRTFSYKKSWFDTVTHHLAFIFSAIIAKDTEDFLEEKATRKIKNRSTAKLFWAAEKGLTPTVIQLITLLGLTVTHKLATLGAKKLPILQGAAPVAATMAFTYLVAKDIPLIGEDESFERKRATIIAATAMGTLLPATLLSRYALDKRVSWKSSFSCAATIGMLSFVPFLYEEYKVQQSMRKEEEYEEKIEGHLDKLAELDDSTAEEYLLKNTEYLLTLPTKEIVSTLEALFEGEKEDEAYRLLDKIEEKNKSIYEKIEPLVYFI